MTGRMPIPEENVGFIVTGISQVQNLAHPNLSQQRRLFNLS